LLELSETPGPLGETVAVSATVPVKPLRLVSESVAVPEDPWAMFKLVGVDLALKSG